jgi:hypothetical protein
MGAVNRAYLRNLTRLYADGRPSGANAFVIDSDTTANAVSLDSIINLKLASFYDLLVAARGQERYITDATIAMGPGLGVSGSSSIYALPADFYELVTIHLQWQVNDLELMKPTTQRERVTLQNWNYWSRYNEKGYRMKGTQVPGTAAIEFFPTPSSTVTAILRYIPAFAPLTDDMTTFDSVNGWENLIALAAAIDYQAIARKVTAGLDALYQTELTRITGLANQRDAGYAEQVTDVMPDWDNNVFLGDRRWV